MKKSRMAVLTASVCVALSVSAFALPCFAKTGLNNGQDKVMEKEAPKEYMEDFYASVQSGNESKIFLTENQTQQLITEAEQAYKEELGIDIPGGLEFEYTVTRYNPEDNAVSIVLTWSGTTEEQQTIQYLAYFTSNDFLNEPAVLLSINAWNGFDTGRFETLKEESLKALGDELELAVPDDYISNIYVSASFADGQCETGLGFMWVSPRLDAKRLDVNGTPVSSSAYYSVKFDKIDLSQETLAQNTGRITEIQKLYEFTQASIMEERSAPGYKEFSEIQKNDMLDAAKQFLTGKGLELGNLRRSLQITIDENPVMWFTFEAMGLNDSASGSVNVTVSPEFKILGYSF